MNTHKEIGRYWIKNLKVTQNTINIAKVIKEQGLKQSTTDRGVTGDSAAGQAGSCQSPRRN